MQASSVDMSLAFAAGLVSFLSPCVFPLVPAYIGYLGGSAVRVARGLPATTTMVAASAAASASSPRSTTPATAATAEVTTEALSPTLARIVVMLHALAFVAGLTFVFVVVIGNLAGGLSQIFWD